MHLWCDNILGSPTIDSKSIFGLINKKFNEKYINTNKYVYLLNQKVFTINYWATKDHRRPKNVWKLRVPQARAAA